jgi:hypothetical protein
VVEIGAHQRVIVPVDRISYLAEGQPPVDSRSA